MGEHRRKADGRRVFSTEFKRPTVQQILTGEKTLAELSRELDISPSVIRNWKRFAEAGATTAVQASEDVVPASQLREAYAKIRELERSLGRKTMEVEILRAAQEVVKKTPSLRRESGSGAIRDDSDLLGPWDRAAHSLLPPASAYRRLLSPCGRRDRAPVDPRCDEQPGDVRLPSGVGDGQPDLSLYAHELGLVPRTFKRDYLGDADLRDAETVLAQLGQWIDDYNSQAPHSALGMRSPREYRALTLRAAFGAAPASAATPHLAQTRDRLGSRYLGIPENRV